MIFHPTPIHGLRLIELQKHGDDRGFFARMFCEREFADAGLETRFVQVNNSRSAEAGIVRGLHYQLPPAAEVKLMRCIRGAIFDVSVDLRPDSPSFKQWFGCKLTADDRRMAYVPRGCAHGFMSLAPASEVVYFASAFYAPQQERGLRWDDPTIGVTWPIDEVDVSPKDAAWPDFDPESSELRQMRGLCDGP
jgi:dTDP-4-dehydrorhamnose 3,5-epimerase